MGLQVEVSHAGTWRVPVLQYYDENNSRLVGEEGIAPGEGVRDLMMRGGTDM